jgi:ferredoxin
MTFRLVLDPIACDGHGICAELFPEGIRLDDWGYPILTSGDVPPAWRAHARRAATACPKLALTIDRGDERWLPRQRGTRPAESRQRSATRRTPP